MPKRQKAKVRPTTSTIDKKPSARKLARIERQNENEEQNKFDRSAGIATPWEMSKHYRLKDRQLAGKSYSNWRKANASSIGEKPSISNTLI